MNFAGSDLYLVQDGGSLGSLSLPEQHQASDDVTGYDVQIPEELGEEARHLRVGVLRKRNRTKQFLFKLLMISSNISRSRSIIQDMQVQCTPSC